MFMVEIDGNPVKMLGDTGAPVNIIGENAFYTLHPKPTLQPFDTTLYPYGKDRPPIALLGMFTATLSSNYAQDDTCVYVTKGNECALLSRDSAEILNSIKINRDAIVSEINTASPTPTQTCQEFQDLFTGIGILKGVQLQLHINKDVQPTAQPHLEEPFHLRSKIEAELKKLEDLAIIEDAVGSTPWVSNMVAAPKPKVPESVRIFVDMRIAKKAIERERLPMPTVEEIIHNLNGATVFSKLDLNAGYHQIELHPDSRYITTFSTHTGLKRYKRLNFGICSAAEVFQYCIQTALAGLPGVRNFSDDIIVYGKTHEEHNANLHKVFERLPKNGLTLNGNKCEFGKSSLEFYGYKFSDKGMEIPDYATLTEPLRRLTHQTQKWMWTKEQDDSLTKLKELLIASPALAYFDHNKQTTIYVEASPVGLGAILTQKHPDGQKVITYASKALSPVEQRYSQTEQEALAVVWACEHFHVYIFGAPVTVVTDHKPLLGIYGKASSRTSADSNGGVYA